MTTGRERPRLFLCPTGAFTFLPLHAAGMYRNSDGRGYRPGCLSDYCVTSYIPTISALNNCINASFPLQRADVRVLLAAAPQPFMFGSLPFSVDEVKIVRHLLPTASIIPLPPSSDCTLDPSSGVTKEDIFSRLPDASIFHVSCHGHQDVHDPIDSGFILRDEKLRLAELMQLKLPHARLAFLSACETAKGDKNQPDQVVHLAAAMLFTGFSSVIGTMWSMGDVDGPIVAECVYRDLFAGDGQHLDMDVLPYALDAAVRQLREQGVEPSRWAPYIHLGL
jgi:CHAT domain-containing protein